MPYSYCFQNLKDMPEFKTLTNHRLELLEYVEEAVTSHEKAAVIKQIIDSLVTLSNINDFHNIFKTLTIDDYCKLMKHDRTGSAWFSELTTTEKLLQSIRKRVIGRDDMFMTVMHRLSEQHQRLESEASRNTESNAIIKKTHLFACMKAMQAVSDKEDPVAFYAKLLEYIKTNPSLIARRSKSSYYTESSTGIMIKKLKLDLLSHATKETQTMSAADVSTLSQLVKARDKTNEDEFNASPECVKQYLSNYQDTPLVSNNIVF